MNTTKISNYGKLVAFFVVVAVLLSTFAIAAGGWQNVDPPDGGTAPNDDDKNDTSKDEPNQEGNQPNNPLPEAQKYFDYITGTEVTEEASLKKQFAYVIDSSSPLYGIADCPMLIEFPTESGTRFLMLANRSKEYIKVGSIAPTRNYISNLACILGATLVSLGKDDAIAYDCLNSEDITIDLLKNAGSYYSEYTYFSYTNPDLVNPLSNSTSQNTVVLPYELAVLGNKAPLGNIFAYNISLPYLNQTSLRYSSQTHKYTLIKSNSDRIDVSSPSEVAFDNVLILFSDSMTYENANSTQMVLNTFGSGEGYYVQNGMAERISWALTAEGVMTFYNTSGAKLTVNRGNSYIAFVKSSKINNVIFS